MGRVYGGADEQFVILPWIRITREILKRFVVQGLGLAVLWFCFDFSRDFVRLGSGSGIQLKEVDLPSCSGCLCVRLFRVFRAF